MPPATSTKLNTSRRAKALLIECLRERQGEIEGEILARIHGDGAPTEVADPEYADGLRSAIPAAIDYCLAAVRCGEGRPPPIPAQLLIQARVAARNRVSLNVVLRRYFAGYTLLGDFLVDEAEAVGLSSADLKRILRALATSFDRLVEAVSEEHGRELRDRDRPSSALRRTELIDRLLAGEPLDCAELGYDLTDHHLGAIASGPGVEEALRNLAKSLDCRLLLVRRSGGAVWAWLGGQYSTDPERLAELVSRSWPPRIVLATGEPAPGRGGWRLTHRQARAALPLALRSPQAFMRYADVALLASLLRDDLLVTSLRQLYLQPLEDERDEGESLRETLRAYYAAERNISSAAAALGVSRQAVAKRLRTVQKKLGRSLGACATELEVALRLSDNEPQPNADISSPNASPSRRSISHSSEDATSVERPTLGCLGQEE